LGKKFRYNPFHLFERYFKGSDPMNPLSPLSSLLKSIQMASCGRVHFLSERVNEEIWLEGEKWIIFRQVKIDPTPEQPLKAGAIFRPRFHVAGMPPRLNILFSWLPIPFFIGLPGFRSKLWLVNPENGDFSGYYEWDSVADAENYGRSFAMQFMSKRSVAGSVSFKVISQA
jgi:hypothetical protein